MKKRLLPIVFSTIPIICAYAQVDTTQTLKEVEITAKYLSPVSVMGQSQSLRSLPMSVSVVNPMKIKELNITTIDQAMQQVTGVTTIVNDYMRSHYKSRGYNMSITYDGLPSYNSLALSQQFDLSFYEQVEVLRGVSSIIQGVPDGQSLGGVIHLMRKKAGRKFGLNTAASTGTWNNNRIEIDLNAPLTKDGKLRSRWVAFLHNREFFYDRSSVSKEGAYGIIEWDATPTTLLSLSYAYQRSNGDVLYNGLPALRETSDDNSRHHLNVARSFNPTPDWDYTKWKTQELMLSLGQQLSKDWRLTAKAGLKWQEQVNKYGFAGTVTSADTSSNYLRGYNDENLPRFASAIDLSGQFRLFRRNQQLFAGINLENFIDYKKTISAYYKTKFGDPFNVPDFQVPYDKLNLSKMRVRQDGLYAQLRLSPVEKVNISLGGRLSSVYAHMYDFSNSEWVKALRDEFHLSPFAGFTYDIIEPLTIYGSYSTIFVPQTERREDGSMLDPRNGFQTEAGLKSSFFNDHLRANFAFFYIRDDDRAYRVSPAPAYINGGRVENQGFELEIEAYPYKGLELSAGYTYLDTEITKSSDGDEGMAFSPVEPRHNFKFFATYRFKNGALKGLGLGANMMACSKSYASVFTPERSQAGYAIINAFASYDFTSRIGLYFNCNNLTDRKYYARVGGNGDYYGEPRNATICLRCSF